MVDTLSLPLFGTIGTYEDLVDLIRARRLALGLSQLDLDEAAGLPTGYTGHLETMAGKGGCRTIGATSLPLVLGAIGLRLAVIEDKPPAITASIIETRRRRAETKPNKRRAAPKPRKAA